jgi:prophage antirepressor-like protein
MSNIIPFQYEQNKIRVVKDEEGEPWWVAKDVCSALGLTDTGRAIKSLDEDESKIIRVTEPENLSKPNIQEKI